MKRVILWILLAIVIVGAVLFKKYYSKIFEPATLFANESIEIFIPSKSTYEDVLEILKQSEAISNTEDFDWIAEKKKYNSKIKPGHYLIKNGMSNNDLVNMLRAGNQAPVKLILQSVRLPEDLASKASRYIEADSLEILAALLNPDNASKYGFSTESFRSMFIPNTYEFWWNTDSQGFMKRMAEEYKKFWNADRIAAASAIGLSQSEVSCLASIVKAECMKTDEAPTIAGVYLNRLNKGIALQADPTLVYAIGDFNLNRVLDVHKQVNSPYNTYMYPGLPPGPINYPEGVYIDAVLHPEKHNYIYFCAKADFSGYHSFAKSYDQHLVNARAYQRELNKRKIYK